MFFIESSIFLLSNGFISKVLVEKLNKGRSINKRNMLRLIGNSFYYKKNLKLF